MAGLKLYPETILIIRHGESQGNLLSREERVRLACGTNLYELTNRGREQSRITGDWVEDNYPKIHRVIRSYYARTRETAEIMFMRDKIREDERLAEANRGIWHVRTEEQIRLEAPWELDRRRFEGLYHYRPIGGENWPDIEGRVRGIRTSLRNRYPMKQIALVTHGFWTLLWQKLEHHWTIEETMIRYEHEDVIANASVLIYHGTIVDGKSCLTHDPEKDYIIPWKGML